MQTTFRNLILLEYGKPLPDNLRSENGLYPVYGANGVKDRSNEYLYDCPTLIIGRKGSAGEINLSEDKFWPLDVTYFVKFDVKILDLHYLYYLLRKQNLPLLAKGVKPGLNREDVYNISVAIPSLDQQKRIAERLDKVQELIALQKEQLKKLDDLIKSRFIDLFGNPETNTKHWPLISWDSLFSVVTGKLDANAMEENGKYPFFTCAKESFRINSYAFDQKALLLAGNNATADYDVKFYEGKFNAYQRTYVISLKNEQCSYIVYKFLLEQKLQLMKRLSKGTNTRYLTLSILKDFKFLDLPVEQQTQFADFVTKIEAQKGLLATRLSHLETLYKSLMQEYFG